MQIYVDFWAQWPSGLWLRIGICNHKTPVRALIWPAKRSWGALVEPLITHTPVYHAVKTEGYQLMLGGDLRWTGVLSRGKLFSAVCATETGDKTLA